MCCQNEFLFYCVVTHTKITFFFRLYIESSLLWGWKTVHDFIDTLSLVSHVISTMNNPREEIILGLKNVLNDSQDSGGSVVKNPPANTGDVDSSPGLGRCPGERNGNSLQYSCRGNPRDWRVWWATVHGITKESNRTEQLNK